jgi:hypothetical protein
MGVIASDATTLSLLDQLITEMAQLFPDANFHFGADEACKHDNCPGNCTYPAIHVFEKHVQGTVRNLGKTPMAWNDVFSDPKATAPNAAEHGTLIQNWGKQALPVFGQAGFAAIDSSYQTMYLGQQCCRVDPPSGPHDKYSLCFWRDSGAGMVGDLKQFMYGGEVAMWSDMYCPSPHCSINGTFGWMYGPEQDAVFMESFGKMIFPAAAAAAGSLWNYNASLTPHNLPSTEFLNAMQAHTALLLDRDIPSCAGGCACNWGSSCIGKSGSDYGGSPTKPNTLIHLTNTGCDFNVHVKKRSPCSTLTGKDLAVLKKGDSYTVQGEDFILLGIDHTVEKDGDVFSTWVGDATWMNVHANLEVTCDAGTYIYMNPAK